MSFTCRPGPLVAENPWSKYETPNGFVEEYLLRIQNGRRKESDLIDSISEYWSDFAAMKPLYPHQDLFPWDCTEAYGRYSTHCGGCNLSKHAWFSPFDSFSIISMHLARGSFLYSRDETTPQHTRKRAAEEAQSGMAPEQNKSSPSSRCSDKCRQSHDLVPGPAQDHTLAYIPEYPRPGTSQDGQRPPRAAVQPPQ